MVNIFFNNECINRLGYGLPCCLFWWHSYKHLTMKHTLQIAFMITIGIVTPTVWCCFMIHHYPLFGWMLSLPAIIVWILCISMVVSYKNNNPINNENDKDKKVS